MFTNKSLIPESIKQLNIFTSQNGEPSIDSTLDGITIDWSDENQTADDSIRIDHE
jgi:hypothetical protein